MKIREDAASLEKELSLVLRRLYRLHVHAIYNHFESFLELEKRERVYEKFLHFVLCTQLLSEKMLKPYIPYESIKDQLLFVC